MIRISIQFSLRLFGKDGLLHKAKNSQQSTKPFKAMAEETIKALSPTRGKSTTDNYKTALRSFLAYAGEGLNSDEVSQQLLEGWQRWLQEKGVTLNTISCYMRSLRSLTGHAEAAPIANSAFKSVFTGNTKTDKRSIPAKDIRKLCCLELSENSRLRFSRDIFLFCVYSLGMPFVDVAYLQKRQVANGYIEYMRHKTGQRIRVKIEPPMQCIIRRYSQPDSPFVFPILKTGSIAEYHTARGRYNRHLKQLEKQAGISRHLTSYVARHSWASIAYQSNVELSVISKALGHTSSKTTQVYIREIDDSRIDTANRKLLSEIMRHGK